MENIYKIVLGGLLLWFCSASGEAQAQTTGLKLGSNPGSKDPNAILDLSGTTTQGVLLPRISLTGTSNSAPLAGTVSSGMLVYNTATAGDVTPGVYFSNGTQWVRVASNGSGGMIQAPSLALTSTTNPTGTTGQVVYNTNAAAGVPVGLVVWNGSAWAPASGSTADGDAWGVTGEDQSSAIGRIGNVGIGTLTPGVKLDVVGTIKGTHLENTGFDFFLGSGDQVLRGNSGLSRALVKTDNSVLTVNFAGDFTGGTQIGSFYSQASSGGNVGLGTTSPLHRLDSRGIIASGFGAGGEYQGLRVINDNVNFGSSAGIGMYVANFDKAFPGSNQAGTLMGGIRTEWRNATDAAMSFYLSPTNSTVGDIKMTMMNNGNVGIGTSSPISKLHVDGGRLAVGSTAPGTWSTNGSDILLNTGVANSFILLRPNGDGSTLSQFQTSVATGHSFFGSDGLEKVRINPAGNVGIGTSNPSAKLEVAGNVRIQTLPAGSGTDDVVTTDANGNLRKMPASTFTGATGPQGPAGPQGATGPAGSNATADGDAWAVTGEDQSSAIGRIGNVGIGTSSPSAKLHVQRSGIGTIARMDMSDGVVGSPTLMFETLTNTNGGAFKIQSVRSGLAEDAPLVLNPIGGNVGIGTTTPSSKLDVVGTIKGTWLENLGFDFFLGSGDQVSRGNSGLSRALVKTGNSVLTVNFAGDFTGGTQIGSFYSQASSSGNVGLGTTSPLHRLDSRGIIASGFGAGGEYQGLRVINDNVNWGSSAGIGMYVANYDKAVPGIANTPALMGGIRTEWRNETDAAMSFYLSPTNSTVGDIKMTMMNNGNVGIGTTSPSSRLQVTGSIATAINNSAVSVTLNETHNTLTLDLSSGNATVTLPAANTCGGRIYHIVRTDGSSNVLTFSAAISLGNTTFTTSNIPGATFIIQSDGSNWRLINN